MALPFVNNLLTINIYSVCLVTDGFASADDRI